MAAKDIGLKIGIEIHQQLDTTKLFCQCPSELRADKPDILVKRRLYAVAGESGKVDAAAAYEESKKRAYFYEAYSDSTCNVELDEEPPHYVNETALKIALHIALLLNAEPLSIAQAMRKTVVDGSNTSGFQRTVMIAKNGFVEANGRKINIPAIYLEEDSARRTAETKDSVTYRVDRLGIPLVEISTAPEIADGDEAKEVALKIGEVLRACKIKRGIGTIRQDVNMSIKNGARTEIKGVQEPDLIPKLIENETQRQLILIKDARSAKPSGALRSESSERKSKVEETVRNALMDGTTKFLRPLPGAARMYPETDIQLIRIKKELVEEAKSTLPRLREDIAKELMEKGVNKEHAMLIVKSNKSEDFAVLEKTKASPDLIAKMLVLYPKEIASKENLSLADVEQKLSVGIMQKVAEAVAKNVLAESAVKTTLTEIAKGKEASEALEKKETASGKEIECAVKQLLKEKPGLSIGAYMGLLMGRLKGKADGKAIMEALKKHVE